MYAVAKIANLAKNRQTDGKNLNEVTKGVPYKVEKLTKMVNLAKFVLGFENISITRQKWPLDSGHHERNGEYDENSDCSHKWRKIAKVLAEILIRSQKALLTKKKN